MERGRAIYSDEPAGWSITLSRVDRPGEQVPSDDRLVQLCMDGSEEAWSALVDKYRNLIFSVPVRKGFSQEDCGEIFQQVCLILVKELPRLRDVQCLVSWLVQVTSHECSRYFRKQHLSSQSTPENGPATADTSDSLVMDCEREQVLREAILSTGERCRQLIDMLFFTTPAIRYNEVANRLRIAKGSVGFIRFRCLERLRRVLNERGFR